MIISNKFSQKVAKEKTVFSRHNTPKIKALSTKHTAETSEAESPVKPSPPKQRSKPKGALLELPAIRIKTKKIKSQRK